MGRSAINLATVAHTVDPHDPNIVGDLVNNPVIPDAEAPVVLAASQFAAAGRARILRESLKRRDDAIVSLGRETGEVFLGGAFKQDVIHGYLPLRSAR